jgi:hypothetical protein
LRIVDLPRKKGRISSAISYSANGSGRTTINKNLARLERLEDEILPGEEQVITIHVRGADRDRRVVSTMALRVVIPPRPRKRRWR